MNQKPTLNFDLKQTTSLESSTGGKIFQEGYILRKVSKILSGTTQDAIVPIPVFYDVKTGEVAQETLPVELQDEFIGKKLTV